VYTRAEREISVSFPPRNYELAADLFAAALQRIGDGSPPPELIDAAHATGERVAEQSADETGSGLVAVLERAGYEPTTDDGVIRLRNCPFDALVEEHRPLVCGTNLALAQGILDGLSETDGPDYQPVLDAQPGYCCVVFKPTDKRR
jgi:predicted ArsR family transcriptional regulator